MGQAELELRISSTASSAEEPGALALCEGVRPRSPARLLGAPLNTGDAGSKGGARAAPHLRVRGAGRGRSGFPQAGFPPPHPPRAHRESPEVGGALGGPAPVDCHLGLAREAAPEAGGG